MKSRDILTRLLAALAITAMAAGCSPNKDTGPRPAVLATVNGVPVTREDLDVRLRLVKQGFRNISGKAEGRDAKLDLLSQLIEEEMFVQEAGRLRIEASPAEIDARLRSEGDGMDKVLRKQGIGPDAYRRIIGREILSEKLVKQEVYDKVTVGRDEAGRYFEAHRREFLRPGRVRARQIVVATLTEAMNVRAELRRGADFASVAKKRSLSPDAVKGGDLGFFGKGEMPPLFEAAVARLRPGMTSEIIRSPYGYHVFKVEERRKQESPAFASAEAEAMARLRQEKGERDYDAWREALKKRTAVKIDSSLVEGL